MRPLNILPLAIATLLGYSCATTSDRGEVVHIQEVEGFSGYNVYTRKANPPKFTVYKTRSVQNAKSYKRVQSEKDKRQDDISNLYYYRSTNPLRLTRIRLRRFR